MKQASSPLRVRPVIRLFVSSTFSDLRNERDVLERDVFPRLEALCAGRNFQFEAIDLRWGISTEAALDHRTMRVCFEEIRRSQEASPRPNFLIILGDRYGWRPLPEEINEDEFVAIRDAARAQGSSNDLEQWYRRDDNALPRAMYLLQSRVGLGSDFRTESGWQPVQKRLWDAINAAFPPELLACRFNSPSNASSSAPRIVRFQASATEQEIWRGALAIADANDHVLAFFRDLDNVSEFASESLEGLSASAIWILLSNTRRS